MRKIDNKSDFLIYREFISKSKSSFPYSYDSELKILPDYIQEYIKNDNGILPRHFSKDFFYELFTDALKFVEPGFKIDQFSQKIIDSICLYYTMDKAFLKDQSFSFKKGILLMGKVGCGKTLLFKGLGELMKLFYYHDRNYNSPQSLHFTTINSYSFTEGFSKRGFEIFDDGLFWNGIMQRVTVSRLIIDDLGAENISSHFGTVTNVVGEVFLRRYDSNVITFGTTNLDPKNLKAFYGERVYSRMVEMMNFLIYEGNDRRH